MEELSKGMIDYNLDAILWNWQLFNIITFLGKPMEDFLKRMIKRILKKIITEVTLKTD